MRFYGYKIALFILIMSPTFNSFYASDVESFSSKVDAIFKETNTNNRPGCAVGVIKDSQYIHNAGYGMANLEHGIKITPDSIFRIGSVSKQFTAMAIALLEEKNLLSFDDRMDKHIPNLIDYQEKVTIKHMIHHFSGLGDYEVNSYPNRFKNAVGEEFRWGNEDYMTNNEFHEMIKTLPLIMKPETKFHYSNTGYALLALVAENVSGMSLREFSEKEIFQPLGMNDSFFNDDVNLIVKNRADGYSPIKRQTGCSNAIADFNNGTNFSKDQSQKKKSKTLKRTRRPTYLCIRSESCLLQWIQKMVTLRLMGCLQFPLHQIP